MSHDVTAVQPVSLLLLNVAMVFLLQYATFKEFLHETFFTVIVMKFICFDDNDMF